MGGPKALGRPPSSSKCTVTCLPMTVILQRFVLGPAPGANFGGGGGGPGTQAERESHCARGPSRRQTIFFYATTAVSFPLRPCSGTARCHRASPLPPHAHPLTPAPCGGGGGCGVRSGRVPVRHFGAAAPALWTRCRSRCWRARGSDRASARVSSWWRGGWQSAEVVEPRSPPPPPILDLECASGCTWSMARATARLRDGRPPE